MFPRSGGVYVFLKEAYGPLTAFLYGWAALFVVISGGIAAVAVGFAAYSVTSCRCLTSVSVLGFSGTKLVAASVILVLGAINYAGVRSGNMVNAVTTAAKVGALASLPVMALIAARVDAGRSMPIVPPGLERPASVVWRRDDRRPLDLRSRGTSSRYAAGEIKDPKRNLPRALIGRDPRPHLHLCHRQRRLFVRAEHRRNERNDAYRRARRDGARGGLAARASSPPQL